MRVLVTGNMGYVGAVQSRHLRARFPSAELIGHDTGFFADRLTGLASETVLDRQMLIREIGPDSLAGVDAVVHLAATFNDPMGHRFEAMINVGSRRWIFQVRELEETVAADPADRVERSE